MLILIKVALMALGNRMITSEAPLQYMDTNADTKLQIFFICIFCFEYEI